MFYATTRSVAGRGRRFWLPIVLSLWLVLASAPAAMAGGVSPVCAALIAKYGCLAQFFGCVAPPYPCAVFNDERLTKEIGKWVAQKAVSVVMQLITDGRVDWNRVFGELMDKLTLGIDPATPDLTPLLPYLINQGDQASDNPDPAQRRATNMCYSYVSPKYPTGSTVEAQQVAANARDAEAACAVSQITIAEWAQAQLLDYLQNGQTPAEIEQDVCGANAGTHLCLKALKLKMEKDNQYIKGIMQKAEAAVKDCQVLNNFRGLNRRELQTANQQVCPDGN